MPLGVAYVASYLQGVLGSYPVRVRIVDSFEETIEFNPALVGISSTSQSLSDAVAFAKKCKKTFGCKTLLGGYHISCMPEQLPEVFDVGVLGEGEVVFSKLVKLYFEREFSEQSLAKVPGIVYRDKDTLRMTGPAEHIKDISNLPYPFRHRLYSDAIPVFTSRGCPYRCVFCAAPVLWRHCVRFRTSESVVQEIDYLVNRYSPREIAITDDLWIAGKDRLRSIVSQLIDRGIPEKVTFRGFVRSNLVDEEVIQLLKSINYRFIRFGAETGSETLLKKIKGEGISVADHQRVIDLCGKHKIPCSASLMFGIPGETLEDIQETIRFLRKNRGKCSIAGFYLFNPIPGTLLWKELQAQGQIDSSFDMSSLQLDLNAKTFDWTKASYFNREHIEFEDFRCLVKSIQNEFILKPPTFEQKGAHALTKVKSFFRQIINPRE